MRRNLLRNIFLAIVVIILIVIIYARLTNNFIANDAPTLYTVTIRPDDSRTVYIEANFTLQDRVLFMGHEGPDPKLFGQFVKNLRASGQNGNELQIRPCALWWTIACNIWKPWERGSKWLVDAASGDAVTLNYEIDINHETIDIPGGIDSAAFVTDWGVFFTGRALFVMNGRSRSPFVSAHLSWLEGRVVPVEDSRQNIEVAFDLPENWQATVPWSQSASGEQRYIARDLIDLAESMSFVGTHHEVTNRQGETEIVWAFGGDEILAEKEQLSKAAKEFFNYYVALMGGVPQTARGETFPKIAVIVNSYDLTDGEVIDRHINLIFDHESDIYGLNELEIGEDTFLVSPIHLVAHEFFHLWNGKTIDTAAEGEWFGEGLTDYHTIRALHKLGYFDESTCFAFLHEHYRQYVTDSGFGNVSIQKAGEDKGTHRGLVYGGGMFAGMVLDLIIRHETENQKSFDDLMKALYREYAGAGKIFSSSDVQALAEELSGIELDDFFDRYIYGTEAIPFEEYVQYVGLQANINGSQLTLTRKTEMTPLEHEIHTGIFGEE